MKTNTHESGSRIAGQGLVLVGLLATWLFCVGVSRAQTSAASVSTAAAKPAAAVANDPLAPPAKMPLPAAVKPTTKGQHEGVTVHGHWIIEVKKPNGELVKHVEFENSLDPGFNLPAQGVTAPSGSISVPGGAAVLNAMLAGQPAPSSNGWGIMLVGPAGLANLSSTTNAPCTVALNSYGYAPPLVIPPLGACILFPPAPNVTADNLSALVVLNQCTTNPPGPPGISCNVATVPIGTYPNLTGFQISGSVTASQTGQIGTVATVNFGPCGNPISIPNCEIQRSEGSSSPYMVSFTSSSNFPGAPIQVTSGQTVAVTVSISFQ